MSCHIYVTRSESALIRDDTRCCVDDMAQQQVIVVVVCLGQRRFAPGCCHGTSVWYGESTVDEKLGDKEKKTEDENLQGARLKEY